MIDAKAGTSDLDRLNGKAGNRLPPGLNISLWLISGLLIALYWRILWGMCVDWWEDPNYSHGFLVPVFSGYLILQEKDRLKAMIPRGSWAGLPVLLGGIGLLILGEVGSEHFTTRSSFIVILGGLVLMHLGVEIFKIMFFPLLFLFFMVPLPAILFNSIAFPLQNLAAHNAAWSLDLLGIPVLLEGNILHLSQISLGVTEACSGIRSLISLLCMAAAWSCLSFRGWLPRVVLIVSAVPITIFANSFRVIVTALIAQEFGMEYAEGVYHTMAGMLIFVVAFIGLFGVHGLILLASKVRSS